LDWVKDLLIGTGVSQTPVQRENASALNPDTSVCVMLDTSETIVTSKIHVNRTLVSAERAISLRGSAYLRKLFAVATQDTPEKPATKKKRNMTLHQTIKESPASQ